MTGQNKRKQLLQQIEIKKRKEIKKYKQSLLSSSSSLLPSSSSSLSSSSFLSNTIINERILLSSISRLLSYLPSNKRNCPKPSSPFLLNKSNITDIPSILTCQIPWLSSTTTPNNTPTTTNININNNNNNNESVSLSEELERFAVYVSLDNAELDCRLMVIKNIEDAVHARWPHAIVQPFGSFPSNLSTFLSDIDITLLGINNEDDTYDSMSPKRNIENISKNDSIENNSETPNKKQKLEEKKVDENENKNNNDDDNDNDNDNIEINWVIDRGNNQEILVSHINEENNHEDNYYDKQPQTPEIVDLSNISDSSPNNKSENQSFITISDDDEEEEEEEDNDDEDNESQEIYSVGDDSTDELSEEEEDNDNEDDEDNNEDDDNDSELDIHIEHSEGLIHNKSHTKRKLELRKKSLPTREGDVAILKSLSSFLRSVDYVEALELRRAAKVPIINLIHKGGIECDISIGLTNDNTKELVQFLSYQSIEDNNTNNNRYSKMFYEISSFLKVFFHQLRLDIPYTGGIGSFKLYVMLAYVMNKVKNESKDNPSNLIDSGYILIYFFKYYGNKNNLNSNTVLKLINPTSDHQSITIEFLQTTQIQSCQQLCSRAYQTLYLLITNNFTLMDKLVEHHLRKNKKIKYQKKSILLYLIHKCDEFIEKRTQSSRLCLIKCPLLQSCDKDHMGKIILKELQNYLDSPLENQVTVNDIKKYNPLMWERMRSFSTIPIIRSLRSNVNYNNGSNNNSSNNNSNYHNRNNRSESVNGYEYGGKKINYQTATGSGHKIRINDKYYNTSKSYSTRRFKNNLNNSKKKNLSKREQSFPRSNITSSSYRNPMDYNEMILNNTSKKSKSHKKKKIFKNKKYMR